VNYFVRLTDEVWDFTMYRISNPKSLELIDKISNNVSRVLLTNQYIEI